MLDGALTEAFHRAGMLAADGACKSFDAAADGYGRGEGCGVVVLKRAADARAAGDRVRAMVSGVAVNQDGLSNGLTAPNGRAQEDVIKAALAAAGIEGSAVAYVETHGTGTPLGDPVEANALAAALGAADPGAPGLDVAAGRRSIGTVKANIGHLEAAAGIAGLIKIALVLERRIIPPLAGLGEPNPLISGAVRHFDLPRRAAPLPDGARFAGVSSFGFGGANAHVILSVADPPARADQFVPTGAAALCLSGRDESALRAVAAAWRDALRADPERPASVWAANALRRRTARRHRLAVVGRDAGELADRLERWLGGETQPAGEGSAPEQAMASAWLAGQQPDWRAIWPVGLPPLLDLPPYPFQRQRCWAPGIPAAPQPAAAALPDDTAGGTIEDRLTAIIARLLDLDPAGLDRNERFIEMGADSIVLAGAVREIEQRFGTTIDFRQILEETPTIAALAAHLAHSAAPAPVVEARPGAAPATIAAALDETERTLATLLAQQQRLRALVAGAAPGGVELPAALAGTRDAPVASVWTDRTAGPAETASSAPALAALSARYLPRTAGSKRLAAAARNGLADVRAAAGFRGSIKELLYPLAADRAAGARMVDIDGNEYVDLAMGFGVLLFGYAPDFVIRALAAELARGMPLGPQSRIAGEVADLLRQLTGMERVGFATTGTEAVMTALRLARAVTGRRKVVIFEGAYHGHFDGVLGVARETGNRLETLPLAPGILPGAVADLVVLPYAGDRSLEIIRMLGEQIAAVLVEPVQSRRPDLQPREFLHALRAACDRSGSALVFDEMITGFRIAAGGAQAHFGVRADLVTYGKILGGGLPIGVVAGARRFLDALDGGAWNYGDDSGPYAPTTFFAGTFNKHPLAMAAAHAVLGHLIAEGPALYERLNDRAASLDARLAPLLARAGITLARFGSMFRFSHRGNADGFFYGLLDRGLYLWEGRTCFLSTAHGPAELDRIVEAVAATVDELTDRTPAAAAALPSAPATATRQMLLLADLAPAAWLAYHEAAALRLPAGVTAATVEAAMARLAERHPVLATGPVPLDRHRLAPGACLADLLARVRAVPLDRDGPLWRAALVETEAAPVLMLVVHHAVIDGISLGLLLNDAGRLIAGQPLPAPPSPRRSPVSRPERAENAVWWRNRLATLPPAPVLPTDRPRPGIASFAGASVERMLDAELWQAVQHRAAVGNATPSMVLMAAWTAALHRITGSGHLAVGLTVAGRESAEEAALIGNFAQILPVESRLRADTSIGRHFETLRHALLETYARRDVDMAGVLEAAGRPFDPARPAAFPLAFNFDQTAAGAMVSVPTTHAKFELALNLLRDADSVVARLDFAADLFDRATVGIWLDGFLALLDGLCRTPARRPADIWSSRPLAAAGGPLQYPALPDWLAASAAAHSEAVAVEFEGARVTYRELAARAGSLAAALSALVAGQEQRVAVALAPSPDLPAALWAVHWAGHAYLPLDPRYPVALLRRIIAETGTALVLTDETHGAALEPPGIPLLRVGQVADRPPPPAPVPAPGRLAYLLHSSGSTGEPKCIAVSQEAIVNLLASMAESPGAGPGDRLLALTPLTFDIAALELFLPLVTGGTLAIAPAALRGDGPALARHAAHVRPSMMQATPSVWTLLVEAGWRPEPGLKALAGGEKLPAQLAERLIAGGAALWNLYGPTETTVWSTCGPVLPGAPITLGRPVRGTRLMVLDAADDPVAPGAVGELAIGGQGLARGYWGRPDLTAERFRPDRDGGRLYLTGDLVRFDAQERLHFLGRRNHQVKIAGHRIELDEVAGALEAFPGVARAVAFVDGDGPGARLAAYVQPSAGVVLSAERIRTRLEAVMAPQLVPARLILVEHLPVTANGKIDQRALTRRDDREGAASPPTAGSPAADGPATDSETRIAAIWRSVLGLDRVDPGTSFFALGGTSLMLAHMHLQVTREFGHRFPLVDCVHHPTVRALARHLDSARTGTAGGDLAAAVARGRHRSEQLRQLAGAARGKVRTGTNHA
jgi:amino acid adenylation domain-containing protein